MTDSLVKYATTCESTNNLPMSIEIGHGENADLVASFKDGGVDVGLSGYTARAIYQPKSKWGTDEWYECPCEIVDNTVIAHWGNTYDNGDNAVKLFMHLVKDGKLAYPAIYQISLFSTPGFSPSAIEPIPETIDFSQYTLLNAPWVPLSGNVNVTGDLTVISSDLIHSETRTATFKNILYSNDMENYYSGDVAVSFDSRFIEDLTHICDEKIPITITGVLKSSGETEITKAFLISPFKNPYFPDRIQWQIVDESEANIGTLSFSSQNGNIVANSGTIHGDFMMDGEFQADSTSEITDSRKYIYNDDSYATKKELRYLESIVQSIMSSLSH